MWHCDIANVRKIDYGTLTPSLLSLSLGRKLWCCDAHKLQGPIPHSPNRAPSDYFDTRYTDIMSSRSELYPREAFHRLASPQTPFGVRSSRIHFSPTHGFSYERVAQFNLEWIFSKLDSGFQSLVGFRILSAGFRIPKPRIPDSRSKKFLDSGIRIPLHGAKHW